MGLKFKIFIVMLSLTPVVLRPYFKGTPFEGPELLDGKIAIVTGANAGIGLQTAVGLASRKATVILACRNLSAAEEAVDTIRQTTKNGILEIKELDLSSFKSIRRFANDINGIYEKIDILVNNAGIASLTKEQRTVDGFDMIFGTNHLGHFLLTNLLLEKLKKAPFSRIVTVSSAANQLGKIDLGDLKFENKNYTFYQRYAASKLANCLFSRELARKLSDTDIGTYCLHPGLVSTDLVDKFFLMKLPSVISWILSHYVNLFHKNSWDGAQTSIYCAVAEELKGVKGKYYSEFQESNFINPLIEDEELAAKLWDLSEKLTGLKK